MPVSAVDSVQPALQHTRQQLFTRFRFGQWSRLALVGILAAELHVGDHGPGFPPTFLEHAFERFSRAQKTTADGSGLGLAIVETIAEAHEWQARAANAPGGGTDVWLALTRDR